MDLENKVRVACLLIGAAMGAVVALISSESWFWLLIGASVGGGFMYSIRWLLTWPLFLD